LNWRSHTVGFVSSLLLAGCAGHGGGGDIQGFEGPDWQNPIEGKRVASVKAAENAVAFQVYEPKNLGTPSQIFVSDPEVPLSDRQVDFLYETAQYGLVSVGEGPADPPASEWEKFIKSVVARNDDPTTHGSAEIVPLDYGSDALITTTEDKSRSDICWLDSAGTIEFCILGPTLSRDEVVTIANSI
jgi:hypothetical protein